MTQKPGRAPAEALRCRDHAVGQQIPDPLPKGELPDQFDERRPVAPLQDETARVPGVDQSFLKTLEHPGQPGCRVVAVQAQLVGQVP